MTFETDTNSELDQLQARVAQLEREHLEMVARANDAIAAAQDRAYWLDRWHLDLNALMRRPMAGRVRAVLRAVRTPYRWVARALSRRGRG